MGLAAAGAAVQRAGLCSERGCAMRIANLEDEPELAATVCEWLRATAWEVEHFDSGVA
ncbi:MAG: hypothetical protein AW12_01448 [Candidatus Accumulibacter sp. BA-94]|nr:MAG: hypothetical protein AW12_01448 [Candidatus Accumulibacter sp. BA-94]